MDKTLRFVCTGTDNANGNNDDNNITFTIKDAQLYTPVVTLSVKKIKKL